MIGLLQRTLKGKADKPLSYEAAKDLAASANAKDRKRVAKHNRVKPEFLYFLASDPDPTVRAAVAANEATPVQADLILARDQDATVREDLAQKVARLAPGLTPNEQDRVRRMTYEVLEILMKDRVAQVRQVISETLKEVADAPPDIIRALARDCEIAVAAPVLEFSALLTDDDLLEIIANNPNAGAATAIARRRGLREPVSDAISHSDDVEAITALLSNPSAQIREETLDRLVERAPKRCAWHGPLVRRPRLPASAAKRLAQFVATNLLAVLRDRRDLDPAVSREISAIVMNRIEAEGIGAATDEQREDPSVTAMKRARALHAEKKLNEETLADAIASGDRAFVRAGLAILANLPVEAVARVMASHSPKGLVALAWTAGLGMSFAMRLQTGLARLSGPSLVLPLSNGAYPMSPDSMRWHLEFLTELDAASR